VCAVSAARRVAEVWVSRKRPSAGYEGKLPPNPSSILWSEYVGSKYEFHSVPYIPTG